MLFWVLKDLMWNRLVFVWSCFLALLSMWPFVIKCFHESLTSILSFNDKLTREIQKETRELLLYRRRQIASSSGQEASPKLCAITTSIHALGISCRMRNNMFSLQGTQYTFWALTTNICSCFNFYYELLLSYHFIHYNAVFYL